MEADYIMACKEGTAELKKMFKDLRVVTRVERVYLNPSELKT